MVAQVQAGTLLSISEGPRSGIPPVAFDMPGLDTGAPPENHGGRVGILRELPAVLRSLGFEPDPIIGQGGRDPRLLDDGDNAFPASSVGGLLAWCAETTGCRHVGLLTGARARTSCFGIVGLLMQHLPTVSDALLCLIEHEHLYHPGAVSTLDVRNGTAMLRYGFSPVGAEGGRQAVDVALASGFRILQALCGPDWALREVLLSHPPSGTRRRIDGSSGCRSASTRRGRRWSSRRIGYPTQSGERIRASATSWRSRFAPSSTSMTKR